MSDGKFNLLSLAAEEARYELRSKEIVCITRGTVIVRDKTLNCNEPASYQIKFFTEKSQLAWPFAQTCLRGNATVHVNISKSSLFPVWLECELLFVTPDRNFWLIRPKNESFSEYRWVSSNKIAPNLTLIEKKDCDVQDKVYIYQDKTYFLCVICAVISKQLGVYLLKAPSSNKQNKFAWNKTMWTM